ncbi:MAG: D-alanyl-D-alanine carboxypeptidase/D-alanyl-D-alanine-endopeptidase [Bacteroides sp.]|nr:D-alanyl-D-alanine carboxypeptidase/D-alanyl-D-alanine-endopeptidase [Bacteroides sp.]
MRIRYSLLNIFSLMATTVAATTFTPTTETKTQNEINASEFEQPAGIEMGIYVADILSGEVLADSRADEAFIPASVMKSITAASVVTLFDPYTRFSTKVTARGAINNEGVLEGDLVIRATGDPTLESSRFPDYTGICDSIADGLRNAGIDSIAGTIVTDYSAMPDCGFPAGWLQSDRRYRYGAGHFPINWRDNTFTITPPETVTVPEVPGLEVKYIKKRSGGIRYTFDPDAKTLTITGRIPNKGAQNSFGMPDPPSAMCLEVTRGLQARGIGVGLHSLPLQNENLVVYDHHSPTLDEILMAMMYWSDNLIAESMLRIVAPTESRDVAAERELALWRLKGADTDGVKIIDGSGLSRNDRLTPLFIADVLQLMALSPRGMTYARLFPIAGKSGTVRNLLAGTKLAGKLALKSGTMTGVRCVAGYKIDNEGYPTHVVVVLTNSNKVSAARLNNSIEQALLKIFE